MREEEFHLTAPDGARLFVRRFLPEGPTRAALQIAHGMAEHGARYRRFAAALAAAGLAVYADDRRGHGHTAASEADRGHLADQNGWRTVLGDLSQLTQHMRGQHAGLPIILFGHSMGSFFAQQMMAEQGGEYAGVILSGSNGPPGARATLGRIAAQIERFRLGPRGRSQLLHQMSFGEFNKPFEPARTPFDWLSRDAAEVDAYAADPLCGFVCSTELWCELLTALPKIASPEMLARIPKDLPILLVSGTADPVSAGTKGLLPLLEAYRAAGLTAVEHRFYEGARHELLNETNRAQVTADLIAWIDAALERA